MAGLGHHGVGDLQWLDNINPARNTYFAASNAAALGIQNRNRHVTYLHDWHGGGDEPCRCRCHRWRGADTGSRTADAFGRLPRTSALQLLASQGAGKGLPLNRPGSGDGRVDRKAPCLA